MIWIDGIEGRVISDNGENDDFGIGRGERGRERERAIVIEIEGE